MQIVVFVPGIMGSRLETPGGDEIWPPTPVEAAVTGYHRIDQLVRPDLVPAGVIRRVCIDFYGSLVDALEEWGYAEDGAQTRRVEYAYDWRRDLRDVAAELGVTLAGLVDTHGPATEIKLICHSMGGLVARACLEAAEAERPWTAAVKLCVFLATPHEGAPLAFARAVGVGGGSVGLSAAQQIQLTATPGYPAGYQLFPAADLTPIWRLDDPATPFAGIGVFAPEIAADYPLNAAHLVAAQALQAALNPSRRPTGCRYFAVVSGAHETITRFDRRGHDVTAVKVRATGDGTVPVSSSAALRIQTAYVVADHIGVAQHESTHELLAMLLGVAPPDDVVAALEVGSTQPALSLSNRVTTEGESYEIVITNAGSIAGALLIERAAPKQEFRIERMIEFALRAEGLTTASLDGPVLDPGYYRFTLMVDNQAADHKELLVMRRNRDAS